MASTLLTDKAIRSGLKKAAVTGASSTLVDGDGLTLIPRADGAGWWRLRYWLNSRENRLSLGTYPAVSLADARAKRDAARRLIAAGTDPSAQRKAEKRARAARDAREKGEAIPGSFEAVAREWLLTVHQVKVSEGHAERTKTRLEKDVFPWLGSRPISEIEPPELLAVLRRIEERGAIETTHRARDACGQVFRYGFASGYCKRNPTADLRDALQPLVTRHHAAITDPTRTGELLRDMISYHGYPVTRAALALSVMLLLRPGELRQIEWAWVDFDEALLTIPGRADEAQEGGEGQWRASPRSPVDPGCRHPAQ